MQTLLKKSDPALSLTPASKPFMVTQTITKYGFNTALKLNYYLYEV